MIPFTHLIRTVSLQMWYSLNSAADDKYECQNHVIREKRFNLCNLMKSMKTSILLESIIKSIVKSANFAISCPFKPGKYEIRNLSMTFPPFLPMPSGFYCVDVVLSGKTNKQRKLENIVSLTIKAQLK